DVGGFFGNPEPELLVRWYQTGAFQPFFRAHAHHYTRRREPWLFGEPYTSLLREAVCTRYRLMPYIYTLFREATVSGKPILRPLLSEFPTDEVTFDIDNSFMVGDALLVHPVVSKGTKQVDVFLPTASLWYDYFTLELLASGNIRANAPLEKTPVFLRGGAIIPRRDRVRRSSTFTLKDPFTLVVALGTEGTAHGKVYVDDGHSYEHEHGMFLLSKLTYADGVLSCSVERQGGGGDRSATDIAAERLGAPIETVIFTGLYSTPKSVVVHSGRAAGAFALLLKKSLDSLRALTRWEPSQTLMHKGKTRRVPFTVTSTASWSSPRPGTGLSGDGGGGTQRDSVVLAVKEPGVWI
ncbi:hypothetical protein HK405_013097, partial [Cladochytrium tenue]